MRQLFKRGHWFLLGAIVVATVASLWAQEAQQTERGLTINNGNLRITRGSAVFTTGVFTRVNEQLVPTDANATYLAHQVRFGYIRRTGMTTNRTDALPTALNLVAQMDDAQVGSAFWFVVDNQDGGSETVTVNGASTGVTYRGNCGAAIADGEATAILIVFTNVTSGSEAYMAICTGNQ